MGKTSIYFIALSLVIHQLSCVAIFRKVVLANPEALCLDGSPGAYYVHQGRSSDKWILSFEGGGWCGSTDLTKTVEDCIRRSETGYGSSLNYPDIEHQPKGIMSDSLQNHYRDWSKVYLKYCTGTGHQGYKKYPVFHKGDKIYFKGHNVTMALFESLQAKYRFFQATTSQIIVTGGSAGGLAAFLWTNYIRDKAALSTKVIALPDAGIFLDSINKMTGRNQYRLRIQSFMEIANKEVDPPSTECNNAHPTQLWKCMFAEYLYKFIKVPLFVLQSPYDTYSLKQIIGVFCEDEASLSRCNQSQLKYIQQYHKNISKVLKAIAARSSKNGYWAPSCSLHGFADTEILYNKSFRIPSGSKNSAIKGIVEWQEDQKVSHEYMDEVDWPMNSQCSGLQSEQFVLKIIAIIIFGLFVIAWVITSFLSRPQKKKQQHIQHSTNEPQLDVQTAKEKESANIQISSTITSESNMIISA